MPHTMISTPRVSIALPTARMARPTASSAAFIRSASSSTAASGASGRLHARGDRSDHVGRHEELRLAIPDLVAAGDPGEIGVGGPYGAGLVLAHQQPHRPVEAGER